MLPHEQQHTLSFPTDTAVSVTLIPIFYMHTEEHPFCSRLGCLCMQQDKQLEALLRAVMDRKLTLRAVVNGAIKWEGVL